MPTSCHLGPCGIHLFADREEAKLSPCPVCFEAVDFALKTSRGRFVERADRSQARIGKVAPTSSKAFLSRSIASHRGEMLEKRKSAVFAEDHLATMTRMVDALGL